MTQPDFSKSMLLLNVSNEGWQETVTLKFSDIRNKSIDLVLKINTCGQDFNDPEVCTEEQPVKIVNFASEFSGAYSSGVDVPDLWSVF